MARAKARKKISKKVPVTKVAGPSEISKEAKAESKPMVRVGYGMSYSNQRDGFERRPTEFGHKNYSRR